MSRQLVRQRTPADDDLQSGAEEDLRKAHNASMDLTKPVPHAPQPGLTDHAGPTYSGSGAQTTDRSAYFSGRYSHDAQDAGHKSRQIMTDQQMAEFGVPGFLRNCVLDLVRVLRERGLAAALAMLHTDPAIDRRHEGQIRGFLAAIDRADRQNRA